MVGESNQDVFLIQIDASSYAEFEISEFQISRVDCILQMSSALFQTLLQEHLQLLMLQFIRQEVCLIKLRPLKLVQKSLYKKVQKKNKFSELELL